MALRRGRDEVMRAAARMTSSLPLLWGATAGRQSVKNGKFGDSSSTIIY
jgi:hypothetical protein